MRGAGQDRELRGGQVLPRVHVIAERAAAAQAEHLDRMLGAHSTALHRQVRAEAVPRENWGAIFRAQGMRDPIPRIQMLDGFNEGWIRFAGGNATLLKGKVSLAQVIQKLVGASGALAQTPL